MIKLSQEGRKQKNNAGVVEFEGDYIDRYNDNHHYNNLDNNLYTGAVLTDLSKVFDCLPHRLLISKLLAYGVDFISCKLLTNSFANRQQRVTRSPGAWRSA